MFVVFWVSVTFTVRFELQQMKKKKNIYIYKVNCKNGCVNTVWEVITELGRVYSQASVNATARCWTRDNQKVVSTQRKSEVQREVG